MPSSEATVHISIADLDVVKRRVKQLQSMLYDREAELLELKGPCSNSYCRLHYAHSGPCNVERIGVKDGD